MKVFYIALATLISINTYALGGYNSFSESQKKVLSSITERLGITDTDNSVKEKIFDSSNAAISGNWSANWTGLNELSRSKYKGEHEKGFVELAVNNENSGTMFLTYIYKPETKQILLITKQIRYVSKKTLLNIFSERKAKKNEYEVKHEEDGYALLQEKNKVSYEYYHVNGSDTSGSLTYHYQTSIDL